MNQFLSISIRVYFISFRFVGCSFILQVQLLRNFSDSDKNILQCNNGTWKINI